MDMIAWIHGAMQMDLLQGGAGDAWWLRKGLHLAKAYLIHGSKAVNEELVHFQSTRGQAAPEPAVCPDLVHVQPLRGVGDQHPAQNVQAVL